MRFVSALVALLATHVFTVNAVVSTSSQGSWAKAACHVLFTSDGQHWSDRTPPAKCASGTRLALAGDGTRAWAALPMQNGKKPPVAVALYRTADGGQHWQRQVALPVGEFISVNSLQFVGNTGWMVIARSAGMGHAPFDLYRTSNGGNTWLRIMHAGYNRSSPGALSACDCTSAIVFANTSQGWATGQQFAGNGGYVWLYESTDGGVHWLHRDIPLPAAWRSAYVVTQPVEFFGQSGVLPVLFQPLKGKAVLDIYQTSDGGRTWRGTSPIPVAIPSPAVSFASPTLGWLATRMQVIHTTDGGRHWTVMNAKLYVDFPVQLAFQDAQIGYLLVSLYNCQGYCTILYVTHDAGKSWGQTYP